jgi:anti-sigma factor RsiW
MNRNCEERKEQLLEYLEGRLDASRAASLKAHLDRCDACRTALSEYEATWALLDHYTAPEASPAFVADTLAAVRSDRLADRRRRFRRTVVAAAAGILLAVTLFFSIRSAAPVDEPTGEEVTQLDQVDEELLENLDLLEDLDFLEEYGEDLELAMEYDLYELMLEEDNL